MAEHVRAGELDLWTEQVGEGPDVVLIGGLGDTVESWQFQLEGLSDRYRLTAFDNRGAGRTEMPEGPVSVELMADDAAGVLRGLDISSAHLAGFSGGSIISQELALRHPELVRSLVLQSTWPVMDTYLRSWARFVRRFVDVAPSERAFLEDFYLWIYTARAHNDGTVEQFIKQASPNAYAGHPLGTTCERLGRRKPLSQRATTSTSAALRALAERWSTVDPSKPEAASPFSGAEDLNDERATELAGILFMEGEGEPAEITRIKRELRSASEENEQASEWLGSAMETSWGVAEALLQYPELADLLSERHRIISNDWQAASLANLVARNLDRARAILDSLDFSPAALREDLAGPRTSPVFLHSACDLIDHGSDLAAESAALVHENERRWRVFRQRLDELVDADE